MFQFEDKQTRVVRRTKANTSRETANVTKSAADLDVPCKPKEVGKSNKGIILLFNFPENYVLCNVVLNLPFQKDCVPKKPYKTIVFVVIT